VCASTNLRDEAIFAQERGTQTRTGETHTARMGPDSPGDREHCWSAIGRVCFDVGERVHYGLIPAVRAEHVCFALGE
jgi:hypothetical protein